MATLTHTYGPSCSLQPVSNVFNRHASELSTDPPKIRAHFFYSSNLPIDDPLTPVPPPSSSSSTLPSKVPPRPFSAYDNTALEEAWQIIQNAERNKKARDAPESYLAREEPKSLPIGLGKPYSGVDSTISIIESVKEKDGEGPQDDGYHEAGGQEGLKSSELLAGKDIGPAIVNNDASEEGPERIGDPHLTLCDDPEHIPFDHAMPVSSEEIGNDEFGSGVTKRRHRSPFRRREKTEKKKPKETSALSKSLPKQESNRSEALYGSSPSERDTTGTPFLRVPSRLRRSRSQSPRPSTQEPEASQIDGNASASEGEGARPSRSRHFSRKFRSDRSSSRHSESDDHGKPHSGHQSRFLHYKSRSQKAFITVGISRLHVVELPELRVSRRFRVIVSKRSS